MPLGHPDSTQVHQVSNQSHPRQVKNLNQMQRNHRLQSLRMLKLRETPKLKKRQRKLQLRVRTQRKHLPRLKKRPRTKPQQRKPQKLRKLQQRRQLRPKKQHQSQKPRLKQLKSQKKSQKFKHRLAMPQAPQVLSALHQTQNWSHGLMVTLSMMMQLVITSKWLIMNHQL